MESPMQLIHVWFATKRRRRILEGDLLDTVHEELRSAARAHSIELLEVQGVIDHVHILLRLQSPDDLPLAMNLLKGISARRVFEQMPDLKHDLKTSSVWQAGYGAVLVPPALETQVRSYIRTQWDRLEKFEH
jgi:putative transposase